MKPKLFVLRIAALALLALWVVYPCRGANIITFDDISIIDDGGHVITNGYRGLSWVNFGVANAVLKRNTYGSSGIDYGMVSSSNVAVNGFALPAEIGSQGASLNFLSAYLTGAWNSNLNIQVQGFSGASLLYDTNVVASATEATLFTFDYLNIDRVRFNSFGGDPAGFPSGSGTHVIMDNLSIEYVPEPSTVLLTGLGTLALCAFLKRKPS